MTTPSAQTMLELADAIEHTIKVQMEMDYTFDQRTLIVTALRASQPAVQAHETLYRQVITKDRIHYEAVTQAPEPVAWRWRWLGEVSHNPWRLVESANALSSYTTEIEPLFAQAFECCKGLAPVADCRCEQEHRDTRADIFRSALLDIKSAHVPDQPPYSQASETTWVLQHVAMIRRIASKALDEANVRGQAPAGTGGDVRESVAEALERA